MWVFQYPLCVELSQLVSTIELLCTMSFVIDDGREIPRPVKAKTRCCCSEVVVWLKCIFWGEVGGNDLWVWCGGAESMVWLGSLFI